MVFKISDIPKEIAPVETKYGQKWVLPQLPSPVGLEISQVVIQINPGKDTSMTAKTQDLIYAPDDILEYIPIRRHDDTKWEKVEVAEDSPKGGYVTYRYLDDDFEFTSDDTNDLIRERHFSLGTEFFSIEMDDDSSRNRHTIFNESSEPIFARITTAKRIKEVQRG